LEWKMWHRGHMSSNFCLEFWSTLENDFLVHKSVLQNNNNTNAAVNMGKQMTGPAWGFGTSGRGRMCRRMNMVQILCSHVCKWKNDTCWNCCRKRGKGG
jgi:hypothetical protein